MILHCVFALAGAVAGYFVKSKLVPAATAEVSAVATKVAAATKAA